jgi:hypothetical protein
MLGRSFPCSEKVEEKEYTLQIKPTEEQKRW